MIASKTVRLASKLIGAFHVPLLRASRRGSNNEVWRGAGTARLPTIRCTSITSSLLRKSLQRSPDPSLKQRRNIFDPEGKTTCCLLFFFNMSTLHFEKSSRKEASEESIPEGAPNEEGVSLQLRSLRCKQTLRQKVTCARNGARPN